MDYEKRYEEAKKAFYALCEKQEKQRVVQVEETEDFNFEKATEGLWKSIPFKTHAIYDRIRAYGFQCVEHGRKQQAIIDNFIEKEWAAVRGQAYDIADKGRAKEYGIESISNELGAPPVLIIQADMIPSDMELDNFLGKLENEGVIKKVFHKKAKE